MGRSRSTLRPRRTPSGWRSHAPRDRRRRGPLATGRRSTAG
jgi:hypothetical protein